MANEVKILETIENLLKKKVSDISSEITSKIREVEDKLKDVKEASKKISVVLSDEEKDEVMKTLPVKEEIIQEVQEKTEEVNMSHFRMIIEKISASDTQAKILDSMMEGLEFLTRRAYFFVKRGEKIVCFKAVGTNLKNTSGILLPFSLNTSIKYVFEKGNFYYGTPQQFEEEYILTKKLEQPEAKEIMVLPIKIKGKAMAVIYVDNKGESITNTDALLILTTVTSMSLDLLPIKKWVTSTFGEGQEIKKKEEAKKKTSTEEDETLEQIAIVQDKKEPEPLTPEEEKKHKEAKRLANVIISDLTSYNKDRIEKGIKEGNIYKYLKHEIDQAAAHFYNKIPESVWKRENYFEKALIEKIANGNKSLLDGFNFRTE